MFQFNECANLNSESFVFSVALKIKKYFCPQRSLTVIKNVSKYIVLLLVALIFGSNLAAQTSLVYGKVIDENGAPLELINVTIKGEPRGTATLTDGSYRFDLKPNIPFTLEIELWQKPT